MLNNIYFLFSQFIPAFLEEEKILVLDPTTDTVNIYDLHVKSPFIGKNIKAFK